MDMPMLYSASANLKNSDEVMDDLIVRAQAGDDEAFGLIFEHYYRFVFKFIYSLLGERSLAEELTQETFLSAYKGIHLLRGEAKLKTWLFTIARNAVHKSYRSDRQAGQQAENEIETLNLYDEKNPPPDQQFLSKELKQVVQLALEKLDDDKRMVFILREFQQLSYKEISEITGHSLAKLKTDLHRAKTEMRSLLHPYVEVKDEV
jgi:RNA polymerase sigma-70 factor, ECF subfamily